MMGLKKRDVEKRHVQIEATEEKAIESLVLKKIQISQRFYIFKLHFINLHIERNCRGQGLQEKWMCLING